MNAKKNTRIKVRAEYPQGADGIIGHMTVDELLERTLTEGSSLACPLCGRMHLSREEIDQLEEKKIVYSERYQRIRMQAEFIPANEHQEGVQR